MAYQDWFDSWHSGEVALRGYFRPPEELTAEQIPTHARSAARLMDEAKQLIEDLLAYRQALAERYGALETMPYKLCLELTRNPAWSRGRVSFDLRLLRRYEDGTEVPELTEHYTGPQRREAISRYEELKRSRPGITARKDVSRRSWEH